MLKGLAFPQIEAYTMASGLVIHIAANGDTHTEVLSQDRIRIGAGEDCDLCLRASSLPPTTSSTVLELARTNGSYHITNFNDSLNIKHNGRPLALDSKINDGDEVRIEASNLAIQFFSVQDLTALIARSGGGRETYVAPFIQTAAIEAAATAEHDDAKVFLREFTRQLVREISTSTKLIVLALAIAFIGGILYIGYAVHKEMEQNRLLIEEQRAQLAQMQDQATKINSAIRGIDKSVKDTIDSLSLAVKLRSQYGGGVCLISGSYVLVEKGTNRYLRYPELQTNEEGAAVQNGNEMPVLTTQGNGPIAEYEFVGTGFYVGNGFVLTNRHVAQPWLANERLQSLASSVNGQPRLRKLFAYFPNNPQPVALKFKMAAQRDDLAVCALDVNTLPNSIPVLPLDKDLDAAQVGKAVVLMGYPNGPDRLLAIREDMEAQMIRARCGSSIESMLGCLADKNRIQPLTTQGNITDLDVRRIVYDARTAEGGSGGPLFGTSGRVIGINFAVFTENTASNMAVPVRYALALLELVGWQSPEPFETNQNGNINQSTQHSAATNPPIGSPR
jgi:S1-C subfamily serine protease